MNDLEKQRRIVQMSKEPRDDENKGGFLKGFIICLIINFVLTGLMILFGYLAEEEMMISSWLRLLSDSFTLPSGFMLLFYLLIWVSGEGAFDAITYGVQVAFYTIFYKDMRETKLPKTYADYRELKNKKKKTGLTYILFAGLIFFLIGIGFMIAFNIYINK